MARRSRRRSGASTSGAQLIQILGLVLLLVMIILFRDQIGDSAGNFFQSFSSEDVQLPEEQENGGEAADKPAAERDGTPAN